jgi:ferredoxin/flavodoxin---NADP+ reductase
VAHLQIAVVGSGPSGLYAADALAAYEQIPVHVDVIDKLPTPFGLVRYGVAPDHVSIRSVRDKLADVFRNPRVRFIGNCEVGADVSVDHLRDRYDAVILSYGASRDRQLGLEGEDLPGSIAATDFVSWYCGHPEAAVHAYDQLLSSATSAVVVGVGNVAIDVTRVLAKSRGELESTDMPDHVLMALERSSITDIHILGRRGPVQAAFTTKELRELGELADADVLVDARDLELDAVSEVELKGNKVAARNIEVLQDWANRPTRGLRKRIHFHFFTRPVRLTGASSVQSIDVERTRIDETGSAVGTGDYENLAAQLVVRSVGYRGVALPGVPFDEKANVIPHLNGRVVADGSTVPRLYVAGWIKRGPTGIIGTNKKDANATIDSLIADIDAGVVQASGHDVDSLFGGEIITSAGWWAIDRAEQMLGANRGAERVTIHDRAALIEAARAQA